MLLQRMIRDQHIFVNERYSSEERTTDRSSSNTMHYIMSSAQPSNTTFRGGRNAPLSICVVAMKRNDNRACAKQSILLLGVKESVTGVLVWEIIVIGCVQKLHACSQISYCLEVSEYLATAQTGIWKGNNRIDA